MPRRLVTVYMEDDVLEEFRRLRKESGIPVSRMFCDAAHDYLRKKKTAESWLP